MQNKDFFIHLESLFKLILWIFPKHLVSLNWPISASSYTLGYGAEFQILLQSWHTSHETLEFEINTKIKINK